MWLEREINKFTISYSYILENYTEKDILNLVSKIRDRLKSSLNKDKFYISDIYIIDTKNNKDTLSELDISDYEREFIIIMLNNNIRKVSPFQSLCTISTNVKDIKIIGIFVNIKRSSILNIAFVKKDSKVWGYKGVIYTNFPEYEFIGLHKLSCKVLDIIKEYIDNIEIFDRLNYFHDRSINLKSYLRTDYIS